MTKTEMTQSSDLNVSEYQESSDLNVSEHQKGSDLNETELLTTSDLKDSVRRQSTELNVSKKRKTSWFKRRFSRNKKTPDDDAMSVHPEESDEASRLALANSTSASVGHEGQANISSGNVNQNQQHEAHVNTWSGNVNQNQQHDAEANTEDSLLRATKADIVVYLNRMCGRDGDSSKPCMYRDSRHPGLSDAHQTGGQGAPTHSNSSLRSATAREDSSLHSQTGNVKRCPSHVQRKLALEYQHTLLTSTIAHCAVR